MAIALIFAGGSGKRMRSEATPKQFLPMHGKPVIIYTLEHFQDHEEIESIVIVCIKQWIGKLRRMVDRYGIDKVRDIVPGGATGHDSIYLGLECMKGFAKEQDIVLIHDGVRPLITQELITENIEAVKQFRSAITCESVKESIVESLDGVSIRNVPNRNHMYVAKAPQSFYYGDIYELYARAQKEGRKSIDSAHLCDIYKAPMHMIRSPRHNMKITDPVDYYMCRAIYDALENESIWGI